MAVMLRSDGVDVWLGGSDPAANPGINEAAGPAGIA
jgi:hypothetical protein